MSDTPPPAPSGMPPPPPPPGFADEEDEDEFSEILPEPESSSIDEPDAPPPAADFEAPPPPPAGFDAPPPPPAGFDTPPPPPAGFDTPPPPPAGFDAPPPPPPGLDSPEPVPTSLGPPPTSPPSGYETGGSSPGTSAGEVEGSAETDEEDVALADSLAFFENQPASDEPEWFDEEPTDSKVSDINAALDAALEAESSGISTDPFADKGTSVPPPPPPKEASPQLSPNLRHAAEVDAIPGDKLYVTLKEKEESVLNPDGSVRQQTIDGELILRNSSRKDRVWDIEIQLQNTSSTDIGGGAITVRELDATETTNLPYTASGPRMLIVSEHIDTEPERSQEPSLSMVFAKDSQEILVRLHVENVALVSLNEVVVRRALPDNFELDDGAEYDIKDGELIWRIGRLSVGESATLAVNPRVTTRTIQRFATGAVSAAYACEATVSRAQFDSVSSRARQFGYVSPREDDRPDVFYCKLVVENRSSFVVSLSGATVWLAGREKPFLEMHDLREDIPPEGLWDSLEKRIETIDKPNFTHEINYSILPRANVESTGHLELKERSIKVLDAEVNKQYSISRIRSYVPSDLDCTTVVENTGTAPINVMRLLDDIPGIFTPPQTDQVRIEIEGTDLKEEQYRIEVVDGTQLEEHLVSPDSQGHALRITVGTSAPLGLQPGKSLIISYPLHAADPSPKNGRLAAPIRSDFSMERFGPVATRYSNRAPMIRVVHRRRRFSTGKEVFPAAGPGRYEILLMFQNDSDSALEDLTLHDVVPGTFNIERSSVRSTLSGEREVDFTKEPAREGIHVSWPIGRIEQNERIEVVLEIQGDAESEYKVADAQDYHGATFGDEVDEEPNLPEWVDEAAKEKAAAGSRTRKAETESELDQESDEEPDEELDEGPEEDSDEEAEDELEEESGDTAEEEVEDWPEYESEDASEENSEPESEAKDVGEPVPDICPACGTEASIGASLCETCSYQFK